MRRLTMAVAGIVALSIPVSVATIAVSTPAWATSSVSCTALKSGGDTFFLHSCTPLTAAEKTLSGAARDLTKVGGPTTYHWKWNGGATTVVSLSVVRASGPCPKGYIGYADTGTVTGGTATSTQVGDSILMHVCEKGAPPHMYALRLPVGSVASL
jgi:hypothetical protein